MIGYDIIGFRWTSSKNRDDQGMPSTDLTGETQICSCIDCVEALVDGKGSNIAEVRTIAIQTHVED